jgi:hypothetical protein
MKKQFTFNFSILCIVSFSILLPSTKAVLVNISNVIPRRDLDNAILDAHDSKILSYNGLYHWFAASYGNCTEPSGSNGCASVSVGACGFQTDHNVSLYTSPDLVTWTNKGVVFGAIGNLPPNSVLFAPKTVYNPKTKLFVMFFNYIVNTFSSSYYGIATSTLPTGPFVIQNKNIALRYQDNGDENLLVDDDGTAYLIYTTLSHSHSMSIERLADDYLTSLGATDPSQSSGIFGDSNVEAPAVFKRHGIYYAVFGSCCCYCGSGSVVTVYTSIAGPLGPYTKRTTLAASSSTTSSSSMSYDGDQNFGSQQTDIFSYFDSSGVEQFMYIGDHWQSAPDGLKSHDFTVWAPLIFTTDGNVTTRGFESSFVVDVAKP